MFMVNMSVTLEDGSEHELVAGPRDLLTWERTSKGKKLGELLPISDNGEDMDLRRLSLVEMYRLAHITARREGIFSGDLDSFEQTAVVVLTGGGSPDPTQPGRSGGSSSRSPSKRGSRRPRGQQNQQPPSQQQSTS